MYNYEYTTGYPNNYGGHNYYQNLYNMFGGYNPIVDKNFNAIKRLGFRTGCVMLSMFFMQILTSFVLFRTPLSELYYSDAFYMHGISSASQMFYTFLPFFVLYLVSKPSERNQMNIFDLPESKPIFVLAVFSGLMVCLLGNTANTFFSAILTVFGLEFTTGVDDVVVPTSAPAILMYIIDIAVLPALFEEFAFRSVIMQPLRKYGDWFAILMTSLIFAVMHGNMVQIPFAFVAGIALGYFCIKTKSIWTSVTVHFLNNFLSAVFGLYIDRHPDSGVFVYYIVTSALIFIGAVAMIVFKFNCNTKVKKDATVMSKDKKLKKAAYICTPTTLAAIFFAILLSLGNTNISNGMGIIMLLAACIAVICTVAKRISTVRSDVRIKAGAMYTVSIVITIIASIFIVFSVFSSAV